MKRKYSRRNFHWQPELDRKGWIVGYPGLRTIKNEVWRKRSTLMRDYPKCNPISHIEGAISNYVLNIS